MLSSETSPLISVILPVYNAERFVADAINSILAQTHSNLEFIIVDDGSVDNSPHIVREFAARDARIMPVFLPHQGQAYALNAGVALARGEFIAHLDNDDVALPERLAIELAWLRRTGADICGAQLKRFEDASSIFWFPESHQAICHELLFQIGLHHGTSLVRAQVAKENLFNVESRHMDYELLLRLALRYRLSNAPHILTKFRVHPNQAHIVHSAAFLAEISKYRRPYFHALFPGATAADYEALACAAEEKSFSSLSELKRAGEWFVRLAETPDNLFRHMMARRWRDVCVASAHLGLPVYQIYRHLEQRFQIPPKREAWKLWLACALRLTNDSRLYTAYSKFRNRAVQSRI